MIRNLAPAFIMLFAVASAHAGMLTLEEQLSRSTLVVRANIDGWDGTTVHYTITRIIYGHTDDKTIDLDVAYGDKNVRASYEKSARAAFAEKNHRDPSDEEVLTAIMENNGIVKNKEVILLLDSPEDPAKAKVRYNVQSTWFDAPPGSPLNNVEGNLVAAMAKSDYLQPHPLIGDIFAEELRKTKVIVRATLERTTETVAVWRITKTIKGEIKDTTVWIPFDLYERRAEAIVSHNELGKDVSPEVHAANVKKKTTELIAAELTPKREAILFLTDVNRADDMNTTFAEILRIQFENPSKPVLDDLEKNIAHPDPTIRL